MTTIEQIKNECRAIIALAEEATTGHWVSENFEAGLQSAVKSSHHAGKIVCIAEWNPEPDASFIAASRSFTPKAARALLDTITILERIAKPALGGKQQQASAQNQLAVICREWEESKN